jgi:hypothetical protein
LSDNYSIIKFIIIVIVENNFLIHISQQKNKSTQTTYICKHLIDA